MIRIGTMLLVAAVCLVALADDAPDPARPREPTEWCRIEWQQCLDTTLPRVLLVGDSIVIGYAGAVRGALAGKATIGMLATSKCVADPGFVKELAYVLDEFPYAVIHFNNGLHGPGYTEAEYAEHYARIVELLKARGGQARIVLATSTPVANEANDRRVQMRNQAVLELATRHELPVNDLYALMKPHGLHRDGVHFTQPGIDLQAAEVARAIQELLPAPPPAAAE